MMLSKVNSNSYHTVVEKESLSSHLGSLFVCALAAESSADSARQNLLDYLARLSPEELTLVSDNPQVLHYLNRLVKHAAKHPVHGDLITKLTYYFPDAVAYFQDMQSSLSCSSSDSEASTARTTQDVRAKLHRRSATTGNTSSDLFRYDPSTLAVTFKGPQVNLSDISRASGPVSMEVGRLEKAMGCSDGSSVTRNLLCLDTIDMLNLGGSLNAQIQTPRMSTRVLAYDKKHSKNTKFSSALEKPFLVPVLKAELEDSHFKVSESGHSLFPRQLKHHRPRPTLSTTSPVKVNGLYLKNAFDVINAFASGKLKSESESVYLNYTYPDMWRPYDLTVTLKSRIRPNHFVMSKFGVIQVYSDGMADFQTFSEWLREASMFTLMRKIPFFSNYKLKRAFHQWYSAKRIVKFNRLCLKINTIGIRFLPVFSDATFRLKHLSEELLTVSFHHLTPLGGYTVEAFEHNLQGSQTKAKQLVQKYFKYCKRIVCRVIEQSKSNAFKLELEHQHQPFVSDLPLSVQRENHEKLESDLEIATYQRDRLGDFVNLAEQLVFSCLVKLFRQTAESWSKMLLSTGSIPKQASSGFQIHAPPKSLEKSNTHFLLSSLIFDASGDVNTEPSSAQVRELLSNFFCDVSDIITESVDHLDDPDKEKPLSRPSTRDTYQTNSAPATPVQLVKDSHPQESRTKHQEFPPSLVPSTHPKSIARALKGIPDNSKKGFLEQYGLLNSQRARSQMTLVELAGGTVPEIKVLQKRKSPLERYKVSMRLKNDENIQFIMKEVEKAAEKAASQMESICKDYNWLSDVWKFIRTREDSKQDYYMPADEFEVTLNLLYNWQNQILALPSELFTPYSILCISSSKLVGTILPTLVGIQNQITSAAMQRAKQLSVRVLEETKQRTEVLSTKRYDLEGFSGYVHYLRESHDFMSKELINVSFVLKVYNILQRQGIKVPQNDKELGKELQKVWRTFEKKLNDADEFVETQTPIKAQGLQESIKSCEEELQALVDYVSKGQFVDPTTLSSDILGQLTKSQEDASAIHSRLLGLSKWKEAVTGLPHNLSSINNFLDQLYVRQELWKFRRVFDNYEKEWMNVAFKKLDINIISSKVSDWLETSAKLEKLLPENDPVLNEWRERLNMFKEGIHLLRQLSSKALRVSHWHTIFAALGEQYNPSKKYTLTDFGLYNIYEHSDIVFEICHDAMQEERLKAKVLDMQSRLESYMISIIHVPVEYYSFAVPGSSSSDLNQNQKSVDSAEPKKGTDKSTSFALGFFKPADDVSIQNLYSVGNSTEISLELENDAIQLKIFLASPHVGHLKTKGENLLDTLSRLRELFYLVIECQEQWQKLLSLFNSIEKSFHDLLGLEDLQSTTAKFQEVARSIRDDPRILSLMEKRRGQKGFREMQGETLRHTCNSILTLMSEVVEKVKSLLEKGPREFPRLYYLTDRDLLTVVSNKGEPVSLIPIISKIFPAIKTLRFTEYAASKNSINPATNDDEGFRILSAKSWYDESLPLSSPLPLRKKPGAEWLNILEYALSYSLASTLNETYLTFPDLLKGKEQLAQGQGLPLLNWLSGHLNQCVLLSMELHWTLVLHSALTSDEPVQQLQAASARVCDAIECVSHLLLKWSKGQSKATMLLLQYLTLILRQKSEMAMSLVSEQIISPESFNWRAQIHYSTETDNLYGCHDDTTVSTATATAKLISDQSLNSSVNTMSSSRQIFLSVKGRTSTVTPHRSQLSYNLVASSRSLMTSRNAMGINMGGSATSSKVSSSSLPPLKCFVHCFESVLPYGFEFFGSDAHLLLAPRTERALLSLVHAMSNHTYPHINSSSEAITGRDVSVALGRHLYVADCSLLSDTDAFQRLLFGAVHTGSLLQLDNLHCLPQLMLISLGKWLEVVTRAFAVSSSSIGLQMQSTRSQLGNSVLHSTHGTLDRESSLSQHVTERQHNQTGRIPSDTEGIIKDSTKVLQGLCSYQYPVGTQSAETGRSAYMTSQQSSHLYASERPFTRNTTSQGGTRMDWYSLVEEPRTLESWFGYGGVARSQVEVDSNVIQISPAFGCIMVRSNTMKPVPELLKSIFRPIDVIQPAIPYLSEALLASHGFSHSHILGGIIAQFLEQLKHQVTSCNPFLSSMVGASTLRQIIAYGGAQLLSKGGAFARDSIDAESEIIGAAILNHFSTQMATRNNTSEEGEEDEGLLSEGGTYLAFVNWNKLKELVQSFFPSCNLSAAKSNTRVPKELLEAIKTQLKERHLQCLPSLLEKIEQLHLSLQHSNCVFLTGPCGSGKTTSYSILSAAYQHVRELHALGKQSSTNSMYLWDQKKSDVCKFPNINTIVLNPRAYSLDELLGSQTHGEWQDGILTAFLRQLESFDSAKTVTSHPDLCNLSQSLVSQISESTVVNWIVLDGPLEPVTNEVFCHLISDQGMMLKNGERLCLPRSCKLVIETPTLDHMTASFFSSSSLVHFSKDTLTSNTLIDTWLDRAPIQHNLSAMSTETLSVMIRQLLPETLEFLANVNTKHSGAEYTSWSKSQAYGFSETQCFLNLLSAVLEKNAPKIESSSSYAGTSSFGSRGSSRMSSRASSVMTSYSTASVQTFGSAVSDRASSSRNMSDPEDDEIDRLEAEFALSLQVQMAAMLSFAYIWSLGAYVPFNEIKSFSDLARDLIMTLPYAVPLPEEGTVFDYYLNLKQYRFIPWTGRKAEKKQGIGSGYISLPELERFCYISDLYFSYGFDVIFTGMKGTGKTSFAKNLLKTRLSITPLPINHIQTPKQLQTSILQKLAQQEKKSGHRIAGSSKRTLQKIAFFLDDIHKAPNLSTSLETHAEESSASSNSSPILELIRYMLCHHKFIDFSRTREHLLNCRFVASSTPGEYWRLPVRFTRNMCRLPFLPPSDECLHQVFSNNLLIWLQNFSSTSLGDPQQVANAFSAASVSVYRSVSERFQSSSSRPHYLITMHELLNVFEGLLLLSPDTKAQNQPQFNFLNRRGFQSSTTQSDKSLPKKTNSKLKSARKGNRLPSLSPKKTPVKKRSVHTVDSLNQAETVSTLRMLIRLWCHETTRVYLDRSTDSKDHVWLTKLLDTCIKHCFCGFSIDDHENVRAAAAIPRSSIGHTANIGGRRMRGARTRGNALPQSSASGDATLNAEELAKNGVNVETLKKLMLIKTDQEGEADPSETSNPVKLISFDQVTVRGEDLTGLIFAQFPSPDNPSSISSLSNPSDHNVGATSMSQLPPEVSGYTELGDGQVMEVLKKYLDLFQSSSNLSGGEEDDYLRKRSGPGITLYREAIEHCARLYRVMNLPGAHSILLGTKGSGRKSLIRLMAYIMESKLINLDRSQMSLKQCLREACMSAAMEGRHTLLVVSNQSRLSFLEWESIVNIMNEGMSPELFTSSELVVMSGKLQAGKMKRTVQIAHQAFSRAVCARLHVFVCWNTDLITGSLFSFKTPHGADILSFETSVRILFQSLFQSCSHIDYYKPWSKHAYRDIAMRQWQGGSSEVKWQDWADTSSQLEAIGSLAAHVHITTAELLSREYGELASHLISPKVFMECLTMTEKIATKIKQKEVVNVDKLQLALKRLKAVDQIVIDLENKLSARRPQLEAAEYEVRQKMELITAAKERYMEANSRCKNAEETIEYETTSVQDLTKRVEEEFEKVAPVYNAALESLSSVKLNNVLEIMSYREPPEILHPLFDSLCMLFDREHSWESCKLLLMSHKFMESLRFFDRDNVPKRKLHQLEKMLERSAKLDVIQEGSKAAVPLSMWLHALIDYHKSKSAVEPFKIKLIEAEKTLKNAQETFVSMRKDMMDTKKDLENTVKKHKESVKKAREIEKKIEDLNSTLTDSQHTLDVMSAQRLRWDKELTAGSGRMDSVPGHAMLCAASACYLARVPPDLHKNLQANWLKYCSGEVTMGNLTQDHSKLQASQGYGAFSSHQQVVRIQKNVSLASYLSGKDELSTWQQESTFPDETILERCLSSRAFCTFGSSSWPLVFDPYNQFETYLRALERSEMKSRKALGEVNQIMVLHSSDRSLADDLKTAAFYGKTVLLSVDDNSATLEYTSEEKEFLHRVLRRDFESNDKDDGSMNIEWTDGSTIEVNPRLKIFVVVHKAIQNIVDSNGTISLSSFLGMLGVNDVLDGSIIDVELKKDALQNNLQQFVISNEKPEYLIRYKSLLTDLILHEQELEKKQEKVLDSTLDPKNISLPKEVLTIVKEAEASEVTTLEQIRETKKNIQAFDQQTVAYAPLSHYASVLLSSIQRLSLTLQYCNFSIAKFKSVLSGLILKLKDNKVADHVMSVKAHVLHLKNQLLLNAHHRLQMHVFERHQLLLPLLIGLEMQLDQDEITEKEVKLLGRDLGGIGPQLDLVETRENDKSPLLATKPKWITDKTWSMAMQLQKEVQGLRRLTIEISNSSSEWEEYFEMASSIMAPVPGFGTNCSLGHKLLLWKAFKPEKFHAVASEYVVITAGADFIKTYSPSLDEIFNFTEPHKLTLLLQPEIPNSSPSLGNIKETAAKHNLEFRHFLLDGQESCSEMLTSLPLLSSEKFLVVIENSHFLPNCRKILTKLMKGLATVQQQVHPQFRVWVLMPVQYISTHPLVGCEMVAFQNSEDSDVSELSEQLLRDLASLLSSNQYYLPSTTEHVQGSWNGFDSIISKLNAFLPQTLSNSELKDLDPHQESLQTLPSLLYEELCLHNQVVASLQASLETMLDFLKGDAQFSQTMGQVLLSIHDNVVPNPWHDILPRPLCSMVGLMSAIKLLRSRMIFYKGTLNSGTLPSVLNPLLFTCPRDLISRMATRFGAECQLPAFEVVMQGKLCLEGLQSELPQGIIFPGLALYGATWNQARARLEPIIDDSNITGKITLRGVITFTLRDCSTPQHRKEEDDLYDCPVVMKDMDSTVIDMINPLLYIPLHHSQELTDVSKAYLICDSKHLLNGKVD